MKLNKTMIVALLAVYIAVPLAFGGNNYVMSLVVASLVIGGVALSWALLGNLGGMVSFGHAAFFGVGAYTSAVLSMQHNVPVLLAMLFGGIGAIVAAITMLPVLRLRGPYFALAILAYAHIFRIFANEWTSVTGGSGGIANIPQLPTLLGYDFSTKTGNYLVILSMVLAFAVVYELIRRSPQGLALRAMHDSEEATSVVGVNNTLLKGAMLIVSAFMCGMVGAFNAHYINFLEPEYAFSGLWVTIPIVAAIFGGYRTITGPLVGAVVVYLVDQLFVKSFLPSGHQLILGVVLVAMIVASPDGLFGLVRKFMRKKDAAA
jgi:branched-chain amino acid transport system permease protein